MLSKAHVMALASGDARFDKGATVLIFGPPSVGKSQVGCGKATARQQQIRRATGKAQRRRQSPDTDDNHPMAVSP